MRPHLTLDTAPFVLLLALATPAGAQSAASGYCLEELAAAPGVYGIALPPAGSAFGDDLYLADVDLDLVLRLDATGVATVVSTLVAGADPVALEFPPPGSPFGDLLYVSSNNRDYGMPLDCGGVIQTVDTTGAWADFTTLAGCVGCSVPAAGSAGLGEPAGIRFAPAGAFGGDLFVANSTDAPADVMRVDLSGLTSKQVDDGLISCSGDLGMQPNSVEFGQGGAFGDEMYFVDRNADGVRTADATGTVTGLFVTLPENPIGLIFAPGGAFGTDLYVSGTSTIYRVAPDASFTEVASGLAGFSGDSLEFSHDGEELFVADGTKVYRIQPCTAASATVRVPCSGAHPANSFTTNDTPALGSTFEVLIDDPLDQGGFVTGALTGWALAGEPSLGYPCGVAVPGLGIGDAAGEGLILFGPAGAGAQVFLGFGSAWGGPGVPAAHSVLIPDLPDLIGLPLFAQGFFLSGGDLALTEGLDLVLGS